MTEQVGGTLLAERPSALITQVLGSTSGLAWDRCALPIEAETCPVSWCQGIHGADSGDEWITHERTIAQARRGGKLVLEVDVFQDLPVKAGSLYDSGSAFGIRTAKTPQIIMHLYTTNPTLAFRGYWLETWRHANGFGTMLRLLGEHEFAGAIAGAYDLCRKIEGADQ
jgi:hypothetical protein